MPPPPPRRVLITGCTPGGMGAALALAFHAHGYHVYATARNISKLKPLAAAGLEILELDITSPDSIAACVRALTGNVPADEGLDILVNNAGGSVVMPIADVDLDAARGLFDINVWGQIAVTQAFLPLLMRAADWRDGNNVMVVNHTSIGSLLPLPFQGIYNASKAALAMLTATLRYELRPFGIRVVELKTGGVRTNIVANSSFNGAGEKLPADSIYAPARDVVEAALSQEDLLEDRSIPAEQWAEEVVKALVSRNPANEVWKGYSAAFARYATFLPVSWFAGTVRKMTKMDRIEEIILQSRHT